MTKPLYLFAVLLCLAGCQTNTQVKPDQQTHAEDPYQWLEEVAGETAIEWVKARNERSLAVLESQPKFAALFENNKAIYNSQDRIPYVSQMNGYLYNFWRDDTHVRGIYRRTTMAAYKQDDTAWETVLDVDALAEAEGENWVYKGMSCRYPEYDRCLVNLSRGGADATVVKEFDLNSQTFVEGGFYLPESKNTLAWVDLDTLMVGTDFGTDSLTDSGYPKITKLWQRGTDLSEAKTVFSGEQADVGVYPAVLHDGDDSYRFIIQADTFYTRNWFVLNEQDQPQQMNLPRDIGFSGLINGQAIFELKSDWQPMDHQFTQGSLLAIDFSDFLGGNQHFTLLMEPDDKTSISAVTTTKNKVLINTLQDVSSVIYQKAYIDGQWQSQRLDLPQFGSMSVSGSSDENDEVFINYSNFLTPSTLYHYDAQTGSTEAIKSLPAWFDAKDLTVEQHFMTAEDGVQIPYFVVKRKDLVLDGNNPTLLYGYGGFEVSMRPNYSPTVGTNWLSDGGVYVVANIRGGGEYGPDWHQAALKENRHVAFNDFIGVAEDLIAKKITSPQHLGIYGGSNGGLLVGAVFTMRPDLFNAVICAVPLLDMRRYNQLLAGASWMGEYGNPDIPEEWAYIKTYSPYHNLKANQDYPKVFFTTSTRDDRVHPGHARKMAAKMEALGHPFYYYENIEGGHGGASNNNQSAYLRALMYSYLWLQLAAEQ